MAQRLLDWLGEYLRLRREDFTLMLDAIAASLDDAEAAWSRQVRELAHGLPEEESQEILNDGAERQMLLDGSKQLALRGLFIASYAEFEDALKAICRHAVDLKLASSGIPSSLHARDARKYLERIASVGGTLAPAAFGTAWTDIDTGWRLVRNNLAHDNGVLELGSQPSVPADDGPVQAPTPRDAEEAKDAVAIRAFMKGRPGLRVEFGRVVVEGSAIKAFLGTSGAATDDIIRELVRIAPPSPPEPQRRVR